MKIINLSTSDSGGAGIAALRFHTTLKAAGFDSILIVKQKTTSYKEVIQVGNVILISYKNKFIKLFKSVLPYSIYNKIRSVAINRVSTLPEYCFNDFNETEQKGLCSELDDLIGDADIVFVHYITNFINTYDLLRLKRKTGCRIIFTMMDLAPVTGGCHYPGDCTGYQRNCMSCPALPHSKNELALNQIHAKTVNITALEAEIIIASDQDLSIAKVSSIPFKKYWKQNVIIAQDEFIPINSSQKSKKEYYLFNNANIINDIRKGFDYFLQVLIILDKLIPEDVIIKVLCLSKQHFIHHEFKSICFEEFDFCNNAACLAKLYQKSDIFLCTSLEDSGPMMVVEALLCGTPVVTFDTGIAGEIIEQGKEGFVVTKCDVKEMVARTFEILFQPANELLDKEKRHNHIKSKFSKDIFLTDITKVLADI